MCHLPIKSLLTFEIVLLSITFKNDAFASFKELQASQQQHFYILG